MSGNYNRKDLNKIKKAIREAQCRLEECEGLLASADRDLLNVKDQVNPVDKDFAASAADASIDRLLDRVEEAAETLKQPLEYFR